MKNSLVELLPDELESLMEALRRDLRSEIAKSESDVIWADSHRDNVRKTIRVLEAINPKRQVLHRLKAINTTNGNAALDTLSHASLSPKDHFA